jgi:hypothetical protein
MKSLSPRLRTAPFALAPLLIALGATSVAPAAWSADFTISGSSSSAQTLGSGSGQTGTVTATGKLTVSGGTNAVAITGNNANLTNLGTISQTGSGRVVRDNAGVSNLTVTNGSQTNSSALMQSADADVIQMNVAGGSVTLHNYGTMSSLNASGGGAQAVDFSAITTGANTVNNYATGLLKAIDADAVRPGVNGVVNNWGSILAVSSTLSNSSDGIDLQSNSGAQITNYGTGTINGARHGITGEASSASVTFAAGVNNLAGGNIYGSNGSGLNFDGFGSRQLVTINNAGLIRGNGITGDGDGVDVDGLVNLTNTGIIRSLNAFSAAGAGVAYSEGISVGGGTIVNSGTIEGLVAAGNTNAVGRGITLAGNDVTSGSLAGTREAIYANTTVTNNSGGLIRGQNDSAIVVDGPGNAFTVTITNNAGATVQGGSSTAAAIRTGAQNDTITNRGVIDGGSSGRAIDMGAGNNRVNILGGQASVIGNINGGTGGYNIASIAPGAGNTFVYTGSLSNFNEVLIGEGKVKLSGQSTYVGNTTIGSGGTLTLDGPNRLSAASLLVLDEGTLELVNTAGVDGQGFLGLMLLGGFGSTSAIDLNGSALTSDSLATINSGRALSIFDWSSTLGYAIRFKGDVTANANFQALLAAMSIDGMAAGYRFDGTYTNLAPVPLPATAPLLVAGLGIAGFFSRRRKQAQAAS